MYSRTGNKQPGASRLWPVTALILIALAIGFVGRANGLENLVYDYFQRYQYKTASDQILLLTVDSRADAQQDIWKDSGFSNMTAMLKRYGARLIVATQPLNLPDVPSEGQIRALSELQEQVKRSAAANSDFGASRQLLVFTERYEQREALLNELRQSGNIVLTAYSNGFIDENRSATNCAMHAVNLRGASDGALNQVRRLHHLAAPSQSICDSSNSVGVGNFWPDSDGVVRSTNLILNANGVYLPSLALATAASVSGDNQDIIVASADSLTLREKITRTGTGFAILNRYYNGPDDLPAFDTLAARSILSGHADPVRIRDRIVLIGESADTVAGLPTPINDNMTPLEIVATNLSNILEEDYLLRPDWLPFMEAGLLAAILLAVLLWTPMMPTIGAALLGLVLGMLVISLEAWLLVTEGIWAQLATASVFTAAAVWTMHVWNMATVRQQRNHADHAPTVAPRKVVPRKISEESQLDLEFSVLRQQAATTETKEKMYEIAIMHGRAKEYARAEAVLTHLAKVDPEYKDVQKLLDKLTGAKKKKAAARKRTAAIPADRRRLGRYEIERVLGKGAMATVYLGRDPAINRKVAIKTVALKREFDEAAVEDARLQFRREAESAGRLNHPNIITIYDAGEDDDVSYLAMEYFEGRSLLDNTQSDNLLPARWVLELMARAAEALDYAHRRNVVHRDIKPANVMYHRATDALKLTDFGIARLTDSSRTKTGIILGTPSYMSPEQLSAADVTGQSDLYSLGITMYQLLTGAAPFRADSIPKLMDKIMNEQHRPACELRNDLPPCVDVILTKAMVKDPQERFQNGREMAMELRACAKSFKTQA